MNILITLEELKTKGSRELIPCKCKECNGIYHSPKNVVQRGLKGNRKVDFCSKKCSYLNKTNKPINLNCDYCHNSFSRKKNIKNKTNKVFCCLNCSNKYFGNLRDFRKKCLNCDSILKNKKSVLCRVCFIKQKRINRDIKRLEYIERWLNGKEIGYYGKTFLIHNDIKRFLFKKYNNKCCKCGWGEIHPITNSVPLEVNHIDGRADNCKQENLELLCPNCHSLTINFRALNKNSIRERK